MVEMFGLSSPVPTTISVIPRYTLQLVGMAIA